MKLVKVSYKEQLAGVGGWIGTYLATYSKYYSKAAKRLNGRARKAIPHTMIER